jgi:hypothetical protein
MAIIDFAQNEPSFQSFWVGDNSSWSLPAMVLMSAHAHFAPMMLPVVNRRYRNFAPFVRQTGERKAQTCAKGISQQLGGEV